MGNPVKIVGGNKDNFIKEFCEIMKMFPSRDYFERTMFVTISRSHYDYPSMVIIELEGSPPRLPVVCDICPGQCHPIFASGRFFHKYSKRKERLAGCVRKLLVSEGLLRS